MGKCCLCPQNGGGSWLLDPAELKNMGSGGCWLSPIWSVLEKLVTTSSCCALLIPLVSPVMPLGETQTVNTGVSGWEGLSLGCTLLDLSALSVTGPSDDRTDVMKSYNQSEQSRVMKT